MNLTTHCLKCTTKSSIIMIDSIAYIKRLIMSMEATDNLRLVGCTWKEMEAVGLAVYTNITIDRNTTTHKKHSIYTTHVDLQIHALIE